MQLKNIVKHLKVGYSALLRYFNIHKVITVNNNRLFIVNGFLVGNQLLPIIQGEDFNVLVFLSFDDNTCTNCVTFDDTLF